MPRFLAPINVKDIGTPPDVEGNIGWDSGIRAFISRLGLGVEHNVGQEDFLPVINDTGAIITNGTPIRILSNDAGLPTIEPADAALASKDDSHGVATHDIPFKDVGESGFGVITTRGFVNNLNTAAFTPGDVLYLAEGGGFTNTRPKTVVAVATCLTSDGTTGRIYVHSQFAAARPNFVFVEEAKDFPAPVAGVITLIDDVIYQIVGQVSIGTDRIQMGDGSALVGNSGLVDVLIYTGTGIAISGLNGNVLIRSLTISALSGQAFDFDNAAQDKNLIIRRCIGKAKTLGTVDGYDVAFIDIFQASNNATEAGLVFNSVQHLQLSSLAMYGWAQVGGTMLSLGASTFGTVQILDSLVHPDGIGANAEVGLHIDSGATIQAGGIVVGNEFIADNDAVILDDIDQTDVDWTFKANEGVPDSTVSAEAHMVRNATATTIATVSTPVRASGTYTADDLERFTHSGGVLTYVGRLPVKVLITLTITCTLAANNQDISIYIGHNGAAVANSESSFTKTTGTDKRGITTNQIIEVQNGDTIEAMLENNTAANDITARDLHLSVRAQ